ncbi:MAG: thioredoxin-disulfide reductase [Lentisphaerales bacterium]|jgi:thioredoxin reductase (NADPH)|nr:MAG: thioredoxin-disulfide reductase [Lentisphaerales bacterium]
MEKVVIAGSGPAGLTAAIYLARADLSPVVVEGIQPGGQLTTTSEVENYPGFAESVDGTVLVQEMRRQAERFGARFIQSEVASSDFGVRPFKLVLDGGAMLETRTVIIATGASARYLGLESEQKLRGKGVSACATCDGAFFRNVPVAVVGGGDVAAEDALFLTRYASAVTVIHRRDALRASKIMADRLISNEKVTMKWNSVVEEVRDVAEGKVTGLRLRDVKTGQISEIDVEGLFVAIGHEPNTGPFQGQLELDKAGYVVVSGARTSVEGVFAAGDVQDHVYRQAVTAAGSGCMAALETERYLESLGE